MENNTHRLVVVSYELYSIENGEEQFLEKTEDMQPMQLYTGCDMALPAFEEEIVKFEKDSDFKFSLTKDQAYGEHDDNSVLALDSLLSLLTEFLMQRISTKMQSFLCRTKMVSVS